MKSAFQTPIRGFHWGSLLYAFNNAHNELNAHNDINEPNALLNDSKQADTIEDVRSELAEIIEEYVYVSLQEEHPLPEFKNFRKVA